MLLLLVLVLVLILEGLVSLRSVLLEDKIEGNWGINSFSKT